MIRRLTIILLLALLFGCSPKPLATPAPIATTVTSTSSPIHPTATFTPTPLPPTGTLTPFVPKATIKIASQSPLSNQFVDVGTDIMHGAELAVRQLADPLMGLGYAVELASFDDQNDFGIAADMAKQIVDDQDVLCVVGPFSSRVLNQVKEIYHQAGLALISPSATAAFAAASGYPEVNRVVGRNDGEGVAGAQFAHAQGFSRVFMISQNTDPAKFIGGNFKSEAARLGVTLVGDMSTEAVKDFNGIIDRVISSNADLVYFSTLSVDQAGNFFREARAAGYMGVLMGPGSLDAPILLEFAGPLLTDGGGMYYTNVVLPASRYPKADDFVEDFETLFGTPPQVFAVQAYDAAGICMKAIEEASKDKGGEIPTRVEVASAIRALQAHQGIAGTYTFNKNGDLDPAQYFVLQVVSVDPNHWNQNALVATFEMAPPE